MNFDIVISNNKALCGLARWITDIRGKYARSIYCKRKSKIEIDDCKEFRDIIYGAYHDGYSSIMLEKHIKIKLGKFQLHRGFEIKKNDKVLIATDIVRTGKEIGEIAELVKESGGEIVGAVSIVDRRNDKHDFVNWWKEIEVVNEDGYNMRDKKNIQYIIKPFISLIQLDINPWKKDECPLCDKVCRNCLYHNNDNCEKAGKECERWGLWEPKLSLVKIEDK